jgi:hypothetical protein
MDSITKLPNPHTPGSGSGSDTHVFIRPVVPSYQQRKATTTTRTEQHTSMAEAKQLRSFVEVPAGSHFPIQNLPFGVFRRRGASASPPRPAVAIGDFALDLAAVADASLFDGPVLSGSQCFHQVLLPPCSRSVGGRVGFSWAKWVGEKIEDFGDGSVRLVNN